MPAHPDFTRAFDTGLRDGSLPPGATACDPAEAPRRFDVYRNNVAHSLSEALAARFPVIRRLVGDAFFAPLARLFCEAHRPRSPVLIEWGAEFPAFLEAFPPLAGHPYMGDVARIEWARGRAYHAADARRADPARFAGADPARLTLRLHPAVQVLRLATPAVSIWRANQPGAGHPAPRASAPEIALVLRDDAFNVPVAAISPGDAGLIDALRAGHVLQAAAEQATRVQPGHNPQNILVHLMQAGAITEPLETQP